MNIRPYPIVCRKCIAVIPREVERYTIGMMPAKRRCEICGEDTHKGNGADGDCDMVSKADAEEIWRALAAKLDAERRAQ